ncbi:MAG: DUF1648 domain-containing protein, partial [Sediminibacterium sp.]
MKKTSPFGTWLVIIIICIPAIYTASIYNSLPESIAIHFDIHGNANRFAEKASIWLIVGVMALVSAGTYLLINNLPKIDPKKAAAQSPEVYHKIAMV